MPLPSLSSIQVVRTSPYTEVVIRRSFPTSPITRSGERLVGALRRVITRSGERRPRTEKPLREVYPLLGSVPFALTRYPSLSPGTVPCAGDKAMSPSAARLEVGRAALGIRSEWGVESRLGAVRGNPAALPSGHSVPTPFSIVKSSSLREVYPSMGSVPFCACTEAFPFGQGSVRRRRGQESLCRTPRNRSARLWAHQVYFDLKTFQSRPKPQGGGASCL